MAKAIQAWEGGICGKIELAAREDGTLFRRVQNRDPRYGYVWTKWVEIGKLDVNNLPYSIEQGFSTCFRANIYTAWQKWRLPN